MRFNYYKDVTTNTIENLYTLFEKKKQHTGLAQTWNTK